MTRVGPGVAGAIVLGIVLGACGGPVRSHTASHAKMAASATARASASAATAGPSSIERLAARADKDAPGTRELVRREIASRDKARIEVPSQDTDACLRVFVDADFPAKATLESKGRELAASESTEAGALVLAPRGPVCVRRGDPSVVQVEGTGALRVIVRVSP